MKKLVGNQVEFDGDQILFETSISEILMFPAIFMFVLSIFSFFFTKFVLAFCFFFISTITLILMYLLIKNSLILVTSKKIHYTFGIVGNNSDTILISKVNRVEIRQSLFQVFLNLGDVIIIDNSGVKEQFKYINKPKELRNAISQLLN